MNNLAVFYHSWYDPNAFPIIQEAMDVLRESELAQNAAHLQLCFNGEPKGEIEFPQNALVTVHPPESQNENLTLVAAHEFALSHPDWFILYFHSKGATHAPNHWSFPLMTRWRGCMMDNVVRNWKNNVGHMPCYEAVGAHWMPKAEWGIPISIFGGNFWMARSNFLATLPSLYERHKTRSGHLGSWENRYEAEVWIGTGPKDPVVFSYHPGHPGVHG